MPTPVTDLIYGALAEIRVARGGDVVRAEDQALVLTFLNEILERLAVTPHALYARAWGPFPLTPGLNPHTIGPTGTVVVPRRPVRIRSASLELSPATSTDVPLQSAAWYLGHAARADGSDSGGAVLQPAVAERRAEFLADPVAALYGDARV
jgi:hypothetical protein